MWATNALAQLRWLATLRPSRMLYHALSFSTAFSIADPVSHHIYQLCHDRSPCQGSSNRTRYVLLCCIASCNRFCTYKILSPLQLRIRSLSFPFVACSHLYTYIVPFIKIGSLLRYGTHDVAVSVWPAKNLSIAASARNESEQRGAGRL